jgi:hypothetical protein
VLLLARLLAWLAGLLPGLLILALTLLLLALLLLTLLLRRVLVVVVLLVHDRASSPRSRRRPEWPPLQRKRPAGEHGCPAFLADSFVIRVG